MKKKERKKRRKKGSTSTVIVRQFIFKIKHTVMNKGKGKNKGDSG